MVKYTSRCVTASLREETVRRDLKGWPRRDFKEYFKHIRAQSL